MGFGEILAVSVLAVILGAVVYKLYRPGMKDMSAIDASRAKDRLVEDGFDPDDLFTGVALPGKGGARLPEVDLVALNDNDTILMKFLHVEAGVCGRYDDPEWSCCEAGGRRYKVKNPISDMQEVSAAVKEAGRELGYDIHTRIFIVFPKGYDIEIGGDRPDGVSVINSFRIGPEIERNRYHFYDQHFKSRWMLMEYFGRYGKNR